MKTGRTKAISIFPAETVTEMQMALLIRECSGIVCLCLTEEKIDTLQLPMMVERNGSRFQTAFTVSIEASRGVTTGVSAADRVATVKAAVADDAKPKDLTSPGHVFPLKAKSGGVLERPGHTEATVDLMQLAGLKPCGVLCELDQCGRHHGASAADRGVCAATRDSRFDHRGSD